LKYINIYENEPEEWFARSVTKLLDSSVVDVSDLVTSARALLKARNASHRSHAASQQQANKEQLLDSENVKK
jgi:hypothetical protein